MISFDTLPSDIIRIIYSYATCHEDNWPSERVYAWICQHWRDAIYSIVYKDVYLKQDRGVDESGDLSNSTKRVIWRTNIDLVKSVNAVKYAKRIFIFAENDDGIIDFVNNAFKYFDFQCIDWTGVNTLDLSTGEGPFNTGNSMDTNSITALADLMTSSMPSIADLIYGNDDNTAFTNALFTQLQNNLAPRIDLLVSSSMRAGSDLCFSNLRYLELGMQDISPNVVSAINPDTLRKLKISDIRTDDIWSIFISTNGSVVFKDLVDLTLCFESTAVLNPLTFNDTNIIFPEVYILEIYDYPDSFRTFTTCEFSRNLDYIKIERSPRVLSQLYNNLRRFKINTMDIKVNDVRANNYHDILDQYLGSSRAFPSVKLVIPWMIDYKRAKWNNLSFLAIKTKVRVSQLFQLISALPKLVWFAASGVYKPFMLSNDSFDISKFMKSYKRPIKTKLRYMAFEEMQQVPRDKYLVFILAILYRVPRLFSFKTSGQHLPELRKMKLDNISQYPQLKNLNFSVFDKRFEF